jgi:hypothetical protein
MRNAGRRRGLFRICGELGGFISGSKADKAQWGRK